MTQQNRRTAPVVELIEGEPPVKPAPLYTVSLFSTAPDRNKEELFLGTRGIRKGYVYQLGNTRVISYYEDDKVTT